MTRYGWIGIEESFIEDKQVWDELAGVFNQIGKNGHRYKMSNTWFIFGESPWFESFDEEDIRLAPTYDVIFDHNGEFHGFEKVPMFI